MMLYTVCWCTSLEILLKIKANFGHLGLPSFMVTIVTSRVKMVLFHNLLKYSWQDISTNNPNSMPEKNKKFFK